MSVKPRLIGIPDDPFVDVGLALTVEKDGIKYQVDFNEPPMALFVRSDQPRGGIRNLGDTFRMWSVVRDGNEEEWLAANGNGKYLSIHPVFKVSESTEDERCMWVLLMEAHERILTIVNVGDAERSPKD